MLKICYYICKEVSALPNINESTQTRLKYLMEKRNLKQIDILKKLNLVIIYSFFKLN